MDEKHRKLRIKIDTRFKKKLKGKMVFPLKDSKLYVEYMYGGRWMITQKEKGLKEIRTLSMTATLDQTVSILLDKKYESENALLHKLKIKR